MKKIMQGIYVVCLLLLVSIATGCSSAGYSGGSSYDGGPGYYGGAAYYGGAWDYDNYYRDGVNRNYARAKAASNVRANGGIERGGGMRSRGSGGRR